MNTHRKLVAWQECRRLVTAIYRATAAFPAGERFGLTSQFRRAAVSVTANIAEGFARTGPRETAHGLSLSLGSLAEIDSLLAVSEDLGYLSGAGLIELADLAERASKLTFGLYRSVRGRSKT